MVTCHTYAVGLVKNQAENNTNGYLCCLGNDYYADRYLVIKVYIDETQNQVWNLRMEDLILEKKGFPYLSQNRKLSPCSVKRPKQRTEL